MLTFDFYKMDKSMAEGEKSKEHLLFSLCAEK
jgi:hypothetical protein